MSFKQFIFSGILLLLPIGMVWANDLTNDLTKEFIDAQEIFEQALAGDESKTELAQQKMQALLKTEPNHPLFNAYYGSTFALMARDAWMPWTSISYAEKALAILDKALAMLQPNHSKELLRGTPVSVETRLVTISTFLKVPNFMHRLDHAKLELSTLFDDDAYALTPPATQSRIYFQTAQIAQREYNIKTELDNLQKVISIDAGNRFATMARKRLQEIKLDQESEDEEE